MNGKLYWVFILAAAVGVGAFHGTLKHPPDANQIAQITESFYSAHKWRGRYPPDLKLTTLDGKPFELADAVGHSVVILNFWTTWCGPCRQEMPELRRFLDAHRSQPLRFVAVDVSEPENKVRAFLKEQKLELPVALDPQGEAARSLGVTAYPTTVVVGANGRIALYESGAILNAQVALQPTVEREIKHLAGGHGVSRKDYLAGLAAQSPLPGTEPRGEPHLTGRKLKIAQEMTCPCGCSNKVAACGCDTAKRVMAALAKMDIKGRDDNDVIRELNKRFCVGGGG